MKKTKISYCFYRITKAKTLFSFGDEIGEIKVGNKSLREQQDFVIATLGGRIIDVKNIDEITQTEPYFYFDENLFFTLEFLQKAIKTSADLTSSAQFCLAKNSFNERFILPHTTQEEALIKFDFFYISKPSKTIEEVVLDQKIYVNYVELPSQIVVGRKFHMDQCDTFASHIISPFHLLQVNMAINLNRTIKLQKFIPEKWRTKPNSKIAFRALRRLNKIGKNVSIHPTAVIEGAVIGDNSIIGAHAVIRLSQIGKNCKISENVSVMNSVLGDRTHISNSNYILNCFTYEEVFLIHGPYQFSIFGKNVACFAVINADIRLDQKTIKIPTEIGVLDSQQPLLGIAYGHRSKTGGGTIIAAGRIVPNDEIINPPDNIILKFD